MVTPSILGQPVNIRKTITFLVVLAITLFLALVPSDFYHIDGLTVIQQRTIAIFAFTALLWMTEAIPTWTTSALSIVIMLLTISNKGLGFMLSGDVGAMANFKNIMASFANPVIMLFMGGFVLAICAQKVGLDVQLAKILLKPFGTNPKFVLLGILVVIAFFSMFMSNTATAAMMLTFLTPVIATLPPDGKGRIALLLAIPVAANLGGIGTPIGTPPNAIALGALAEAGYDISFGQWMARMVPFVVVMLLISWVLLLAIFPFKAKKIELKIEDSVCQVNTFQKYIVWIVFAVTIILWVGESVFGVNSNIVALIPFGVFAACGIFTKDDLKEINWSVLWMVAGGFALGTALEETGLAKMLINAIPFASWNVVVVLLVSGLVCYILSNFISNSASANLIVPILIVVGSAMSEVPAFQAIGGVKTLIVGVAVAASLAMTLPVSTPPNALACSSGLISTKQMATIGIIVGVIGFVLGYAMLIFIGI